MVECRWHKSNGWVKTCESVAKRVVKTVIEVSNGMTDTTCRRSGEHSTRQWSGVYASLMHACNADMI